jgi:ligand-binding SRPBCC domain-containing protein
VAFAISSVGKATRLRWTMTMRAPRGVVWRLLTDFAGWPRWFAGVRRVAVVGGVPGVGAERLLTLAWGRTHHERFAEWAEGRGFAVAVIDAPSVASDWRGRVTLTDSGGGTRLTWELGYRPRFGPAGRLLDLLVLRPVLGAVFRLALRRLARLAAAAA